MNRLRIRQRQLKRTRRSLRLSGSVLVSFRPCGSPGPDRQFAAASDSDSPSSRLTAIETPPASKIADGGASDTRAVPAPTIRLVSNLQPLGSWRKSSSAELDVTSLGSPEYSYQRQPAIRYRPSKCTDPRSL